MPPFNTDVLFQLGFYFLLLIFTIHTVILCYHWLTFGANKQQSILSLALYLALGSVLLLSLSISMSLL